MARRPPKHREEPSPKLAEALAARIERTIASRKWPVGAVLGSEESLLAKFRVSRAVLREAVRILEHHRTATMRRGPGGGLSSSSCSKSGTA
jgi:DNA-binding FadR family transcriptional regulator